ncbi:YbfB/YjiJ family MFS transporter [Piscinibacter koreensis]|uniref:YbfB/YjiJ family MFS transporter n=1 Tax=Piscinibacter koreensis TaxID=2742824 RepID=A0A7Y6TWW0_9BURK|nr:YbfB/YjiJ family MFS transporter [Schlegelella koreensis]NUZ06485.1 YbfB/YjiJ family MFS transporter [Schlegelella koreensis]
MTAVPSVGGRPPVIAVAMALALGAAVSLGLARFSYALLLPPMRADLDWSYLVAGAMNTVNAAGYLVGALLVPRLLARADARLAMLGGSALAALLLAAHGLVVADAWLFALRLATGVASAATFVGGGVLAARLATEPGVSGGSGRSGLVLGIYYGGTGVGIVASALLVPPLAGRAAPHAWQGAWIALGVVAGVATAITALATRHLAAAPAAGARTAFHWRPFRFGLAGYFMFGLGYIGYMTFVITLLREQRLGSAAITAFYVLLGVAVIASSWLWAGLLQRFRGGESLAILNALLAVATALPVLSAAPLAVFASALLFGGVFLSVVASTTALVRHNLPPAGWAGGIGAFTIVFAAGQIVGPTLIGWVADASGGLARGFVVSALVLAGGALLAAAQKPLARG